MRIIRVVTTVQEFNVPDGFHDWPYESQSNYLAELESSGGYKALADTESLSYPDLTQNASTTTAGA